MIEDRKIKFTREELRMALEFYYNEKMRPVTKVHRCVKKMEISRNHSSKYLVGFEVGKCGDHQ